MAKESLGSLGASEVEEAVNETPDPSSETTTEEPDKTSALFAAVEDEDTAESAEPDEVPEDEGVLFDEGKPQIPQGWTEATYKRFRKVIGQRNELREENNQLKGQTSIDASVKAIMDEHYKSFENPANQIKFDASFMEALDEMAKRSPAHRKLAADVQHYIKTKEIPTMATEQDKTTPPAEVRPDPAAAKIDALLEKETRRDIHGVLAGMGMKPAFQNILADYLIGQLDDLSKGVASGDVIKFARAFIQQNGFTKEEVLAEVGAEDTKPDKPATGGKGGRAATAEADTKADADTDKDRPTPVKNLDEWKANHEQRTRALLESL